MGVIKNSIYNVLLAETKILKKLRDDFVSLGLLRVTFLIYFAHCSPKTRKIIVIVYLWLNI